MAVLAVLTAGGYCCAAPRARRPTDGDAPPALARPLDGGCGAAEFAAFGW
jgi:hypothetical protein